MSIILWWIVFEIGAKNRLFLRRVINSFIIRLTRKHVIRLKCLTITQNFSWVLPRSFNLVIALTPLNLSCQWCGVQNVNMQLCLFTHEFHFIEIGKKIRACGHDFEEAMHAYDNLRNPRKDVTDLIGQIKYPPRWYNIVERNRRHTLDN